MCVCRCVCTCSSTRVWNEDVATLRKFAVFYDICLIPSYYFWFRKRRVCVSCLWYLICLADSARHGSVASVVGVWENSAALAWRGCGLNQRRFPKVAQVMQVQGHADFPPSPFCCTVIMATGRVGKIDMLIVHQYSTVLNMDLPRISLYFARKTENRYSNLWSERSSHLSQSCCSAVSPLSIYLSFPPLISP